MSKRFDLSSIYAYPYYTIFDWLVLDGLDEHLIVSGKVTEPFKEYEVADFLAEMSADAILDNHMEVLPSLRFDNQLRAAVAEFIYGDPYFLGYTNRSLPPIHILVENGDVTLGGAVESIQERIQAGDDARRAENMFSLTNDLRVGNCKLETALWWAASATSLN